MSEKKRLLIVEDERIVAMDLRRRLEKMGHEVVTSVARGDAALQAVAEFMPELVLMDIRIEGDMDGIDTAAIIHDRYHIPHIFLTAHSDQATIDRAKQTDPDGYILKPFTDRDIALNIEIAEQRARFRNELRLSELKFRSLIQNSSDLIIEVNDSGQVIFCSPQVRRLLGYEVEQVVGKRIDTFVRDTDLDKLSSLFSQHGFNLAVDLPVLKSPKNNSDSGKDPFRQEFQFRHADSGWTFLDVQSNAMDINELPKSVILTARDISDRKRFETELMQAKVKAEEMNRLKSAFLSNISHELRTPLTGILGFASILETELDGEQLEMAQSITKSGQRLLDTMESVIDLALMESNKIDVEPTQVVVSEVLQQVVRMLTGLAFEKNLRIKIIARNEPEFIETDRRLLAQVLHNIISNAIKFTEKGGVQITIDQSIDQIGPERSPVVLIHVKDTGIGISEEFLPYIFDEFKQESSGNTRKYEGTGLGLSIAKRMIGLLNGVISVQSKINSGSIFTVKLPLTL